MGTGTPIAVRNAALRHAKKECANLALKYGILVNPEIIIASNAECALIYRYLKDNKPYTALSLLEVLDHLHITKENTNVSTKQ